MRSILLVLVALSLTVSAHASVLPNPGGIKVVRVLGPSWEGFTNRDGTGLYHEILKTLFALYDVQYERDYVPSERAYHLVRTGLADFFTCHDKPVAGLVLAKHPMYEGKYYVFFNRENIGEWDPPASLEDRSIAWRIGYYDESNIPAKMRVKELKTGVSALGMVILGRMDFYLDDLNFIEDSIRQNKIPYDPGDFRIEAIGSRSYHPVFAPTSRGKEIMDMYDRGMEYLLSTGQLQPIFEKWGFPLPDYDVK